MMDACDVENTAMWGGVMAEEAVRAGVAGAVVNGAVRDIAEMRQLGCNMFCRVVVPCGPHYGFSGTIDTPIAMNGAVVRPGDIVLGDGGVVPLEKIDTVLAQAHIHWAAG